MDPERASMASRGARLFEMPGSDIRMTGYLKKMKTMKRKFFVLRSTSSSGPARLEYHDAEKRFQLGHPPKRLIHLHTCFNINRRSDSRHRCAIALYTKEECFSVLCEDEKELERWLGLLLQYQNEFLTTAEEGGEGCRQHYDFVWQVTIQAKGLGQTMNIRGPYRLCLTWHSLYLFKPNMDKPQYIFQLETVRSVGHVDNVFKLILGKISPTGEGELFMQSDDNVVTKNIHETVLDFMRQRDKRQNGYDTQRSFSESLHGSASSLSRPPPEFRPRSETFTPGSNRIRPRVERPMSVCTRAARSTSHIHSAVSPGSSPHIHGFMDAHNMEAHRLRSNSNDSKVSRPCLAAMCDDHSLRKMRPAVQEESDWDTSLGLEDSSDLISPGGLQLDWDETDSQGGECYMEMNPGTATPPTPSNRGYMDMAPSIQKAAEIAKDGGRPDPGSTYMAMTSAAATTTPRSCSAPIPIHPTHLEHGYLEMTAHSMLPPVKEGGSNEGYVPMSPPFNASSYPSAATSELKPDRVRCMLSDDGSDFSMPPQRTYSLGSRPVKATTTTLTHHHQQQQQHQTLASGYMDMSGAKKVSDNGRSCSAPHLVHPHPHPLRSGRSSNMESPPPTTTTTPSASPLSVSLKSDDSDAFMELDFYRPRTASDSYSYRPCTASSFGLPHSGGVGGQGQQSHRPRSSSHGQGTRPLRRHRMLAECKERLTHEVTAATLRSLNAAAASSQGSLDSLRASSSESLKKLSQEVLTKTSQLNNNTSTSGGYMDMSGGDRRVTPSPQPPIPVPAPSSSSSSSSSHPWEHEGYVDMSLRKHEGYMDMTKGTHRSPHSFRPAGGEKLPPQGEVVVHSSSPSPSSSSSFGTPTSARDSVYVNFDAADGVGKKESPPRLPHPSDSPDTYIMYQPAAASSAAAAGKENVPDAPSPPNLKKRPGSGKEGKKRGGIFSLRRGHGDSGKHGSKNPEPSQQSSGGGGALYATTGGQQFGSLGRDFRKKSKDLSKAARQKSSSFSKTFGISASKPGKLLRKSPTPPSSLDGNDEYVEFTPASAKSDSDSSHSSGSFKMPRARTDAIPAQEDTAAAEAYVGFEPGHVPSSQRVPAIPATSSSSSSSYLPMTVGGGGGGSGQGKVFTVIKPTKKRGARRCRSGEDCSPALVADPDPADPESGRSVVDSGQVPGAGPFLTSAAAGGQPASAGPLPAPSKPALATPLPVVFPHQVCREAEAWLTSAPAVPVPSPFTPQQQQSVAGGDCVCELGRSEACSASVTAMPGSAPCRAGSRSEDSAGQCGSQSAPPPSAESRVPVTFVSQDLLRALSLTAVPPVLPLPSCCSSSSTPAPSHQPPVRVPPEQSELPPAPAGDSGYMLFDPAKPGVPVPDCAAVPPVPEIVPSIPSAPPSTASVEGRASSSCQAHPVSSAQTSSSPQSSSGGGDHCQPASTAAVGRKGSGPDGRRRRRSSGKTSTSSAGGEGTNSACEPTSAADKLGAGVSAALGTARAETCSASNEGQTTTCDPSSLSNRGPGVMPLDSVPSVSFTSGGRGRGRHNSSGSIGIAQSVGGKSGSSSSVVTGPDPGMASINSSTDTRHSMADLSGSHQQAPFPSNALSQQQPQPPQPPPPLPTSSSLSSHAKEPSSQSPHVGGLGSGSGSTTSEGQEGLHYAKLDLSSTDSLGDPGEGVRSPRSRSRHSSSAAAVEEKMVPLSYATIDFDKSESLRGSASKDVKLIL